MLSCVLLPARLRCARIDVGMVCVCCSVLNFWQAEELMRRIEKEEVS